MALVYCTECGKQIADSAASCPQCGAANKALVSASPQSPPGLPPLFDTGSSSTPARRRTASPKSRTTAAWLCFLLGGLSVHRFYVGKPLTAILQVVTAGGLMIWLIVDFVRILNGTFEDAEGLPLLSNSAKADGRENITTPSQQRQAGRRSAGGWVGAVAGVFLVLVAIGFVVQAGGFSNGATATNEPIGTVGDKIQLGEFEVTITKVDVRNAIGASPFTQLGSLSGVGGDDLRNMQDALGSDPFGLSEIAPSGSTYAIVEYAYSNVGDRPRAWETPSIDLLDEKGVAQAKDLGARATLGVEKSFTAKTFSDLNPGVRVTDAEVFHVSQDRYDPDSWVIKIQVDGRDALIAIENWPRPVPQVAKPATSAPEPAPPAAGSTAPADSLTDMPAFDPTKAVFLNQGGVVVGLAGVGQPIVDGLDLSVEIIAYSNGASWDVAGPVEIDIVSPSGLRIGGSDPDSSSWGSGLENGGWPRNDVFRLDSAWFGFCGEEECATSVDEIVRDGGWRVEVKIGGNTVRLPLKALGEFIPTARPEGGANARIVGVPANDVLNVRAAPSPGAEVLGEVMPNLTAVEVMSCVSGSALQKWGNVKDSPTKGWCLVVADALDVRSRTPIRVMGWTNGRYLAPIVPAISTRTDAAAVTVPTAPKMGSRFRMPEYPAASRRAGEEGAVVVSVCVDKDGLTSNPTIVKSSGFQRLDEATLIAFTRNHLEPAVGSDGMPTAICNPKPHVLSFEWSLRAVR